MNFCSPAFSFKKDNEDYNIIDCSNQCEIEQEEITDTSSPECSGKKYPISTMGISSSNKKKFSVKRKLLLQKPVLDIQPTNSNSFFRREGHCQRIKRKKLFFHETNFSNENHVQKSVQNVENKLHGNSAEYCVSIGSDVQKCNYNPTDAALTAGLIRSLSPEIFSDEDSKVKLELQNLKDEIICSQDSSVNISFEDEEEQLSVKTFCEASDPTNTISKDNEGSLDDNGIKEEIICSQDSLDSSIKNKKCTSQSTKLNEILGFTKILQEEGHEGNLDDSVIKEEILCSQDSLLDISIKNNKYIIESTKFNELLGPINIFQEKDEEDKMSNSDVHKEEIICSQDSANYCYQNYEKEYESDQSSSPKTLLCYEDNKDNSDFDKSNEDIIYSQDSDIKISESDSNHFSNAFENPNISLSPSKISVKEGKRAATIDFDVSEIDESSERDPLVTLASTTNSLQITTTVEKREAVRYSNENKQKCNDPIGSPTSDNHIISQTELHDPNSEFLIKAPKKGTLLQRAYHIISDLKKEANLLSYEIQVGLRASKGAFVSEPLIIQDIYFEEKNYIISCKPKNIEVMINEGNFKGSIYLIISNLTMDMRINSVIVIHFPLVALLGLPVMRVILFAENRIQVISSNRVTGSIDINLPNLIIGPRDQKIMHIIKKKTSKTVIDAIIDQLFGKFCSLELKLLHIYKQRTVTHTAVELLTVDTENQFCLVKDSEYGFLKDINLKVNNSYLFVGFTLMCSRVKNEVRSAAEYYSSLKFTNNFIYVVEPCTNSWKINHLSSAAEKTKNYTSLNSVIRNKTNHERFKFLLKDYKVFENKILIRDESFSEIAELQFDEQCCEHKMKLMSLSMPVVLCGIYFLNGCLYYDKYSQLIVL